MVRFCFGLIVAVVASMVAPQSASACDHCHKAVCCCPTDPCITYIDKDRCSCGPKAEQVLCVKNPATCCDVAIPVCVPVCLTGEPCIESKAGLLGRGVVFYEWCDGYTIKFIFDKCGDVKVVYLGK